MEDEVIGGTPAEAPQEPESSEAPTQPESSPETQQEAAEPVDELIPRKRLDKVVWQREEERRKNLELQRKLEELQAKPKAETPKPNDPTKPTPQWNPKTGQPFETWDEYTESLADWKFEQRFTRLRQDAEERAKKEAMAKSRAEFDKRVAKVRQKYPDFDEHFENAIISEPMGRAILDSEQGPELVVYLAQNPEIAEKLYSLGGSAAAREIGKLEAKLDDLLQDKTTTDAPAPIKPVKGKSEASNDPKDTDDIKSWMKKRNKQLGRS